MSLYIETSQLICSAYQLTGFSMREALVVNELKGYPVPVSLYSGKYHEHHAITSFTSSLAGFILSAFPASSSLTKASRFLFRVVCALCHVCHNFDRWVNVA